MKVATLEEIKTQGWSLNPGRYVGVTKRDEDDEDFFERLEAWERIAEGYEYLISVSYPR